MTTSTSFCGGLRRIPEVVQIHPHALVAGSGTPDVNSCCATTGCRRDARSATVLNARAPAPTGTSGSSGRGGAANRATFAGT